MVNIIKKGLKNPCICSICTIWYSKESCNKLWNEWFIHVWMNLLYWCFYWNASSKTSAYFLFFSHKSKILQYTCFYHKMYAYLTFWYLFKSVKLKIKVKKRTSVLFFPIFNQPLPLFLNSLFSDSNCFVIKTKSVVLAAFMLQYLRSINT